MKLRRFGVDEHRDMTELTPAQRTASTAKFIFGAGIVAWAPAILNHSLVASIAAGLLMFFGGSLLFAARRAD